MPWPQKVDQAAGVLSALQVGASMSPECSASVGDLQAAAPPPLPVLAVVARHLVAHHEALDCWHVAQGCWPVVQSCQRVAQGCWPVVHCGFRLEELGLLTGGQDAARGCASGK